MSPPGGVFATAHSFFDTTANQPSWRFDDGSANGILLSSLTADANPVLSDSIHVITVTVTVYPLDPNMSSWVYSGLALDRSHQMSGAPDSLAAQFVANPPSISQSRTVPVVMSMSGTDDGLTLLATFLAADPNLPADLANPKSTDLDRSIDIVLTGGNDGQRPAAPTITKASRIVASTIKTGLKALEDIDDISIVAAPGSTFGYRRRRTATTRTRS